MHIVNGADLNMNDSIFLPPDPGPGVFVPFAGTADINLLNDGTVNVGRLLPPPGVEGSSGAGAMEFPTGRTITNNGDFNIYSGAFTLGNATPPPGVPASFTNWGTLTAAIMDPANSYIQVAFANAGTLNSFNGTLSFSLDVNQTAGAINLFGGSLAFAGSLTIGLDSSLNGTGSITASVVYNNLGAINVGREDNPYGQLTIFGDFSNTGVISVNVRGTGLGDYGRLRCTGQAHLVGTLNLNLEGYTPTQGDQLLDLLSWGSLDLGFFFANPPPGWDLTYGATGLTATANDGT